MTSIRDDYREAIKDVFDLDSTGTIESDTTKLDDVLDKLLAINKRRMPEKTKESDYSLNMHVSTNPPSDTTRTNLYRKGRNQAIDLAEKELTDA